MTIEEVIKWLSIMKANLNSFPEISNEKKIEALAEAIRLLKNEESEEPRWIPVSERLPKDGESVLFCDIDDDIMVGYHVKGRPNTHFSQDGTFEDMKNVRAWMPLPEPYKEVEE